jgi:phosphoglycerol transferase MdoB-like AlkP superfamily enzyme
MESFGLLRDSASNEMVIAPYRSSAVNERYHVTVGSVRFEGATTSGELRELCGVLSSHLAVDHVDGSRCLPSLFRDAHFSTVAFHGYKRSFFNRSDWYPRVGFQRALFEDSLIAKDSATHCGYVYRGACDTEVAAVLLKELESPPSDQRRFVYWLTLNSHLPLDEATAQPSTFSCDNGVFYNDSEVCLLARIQNLVNTSVVRVATEPGLRPTRFIIVGDHTPPFALRERRDLFVKGRVPYIELIPRKGKGDAGDLDRN